MAILKKALASLAIFSIIINGGAAAVKRSTDVDQINHLSDCADATAQAVSGLNACGFNTTTQAITQQAPIVNGTACADADMAINSILMSFTEEVANVSTAMFNAGYPSYTNDTAWTAMAVAFNGFSNSIFNLYWTIDQAVCQYELTDQSITWNVAGFPSFHEFMAPSNNIQTAWTGFNQGLTPDPTFSQWVQNNSALVPDLTEQWSATHDLFWAMGSGNQSLALASCLTLNGLLCGDGDCGMRRPPET